MSAFPGRSHMTFRDMAGMMDEAVVGNLPAFQPVDATRTMRQLAESIQRPPVSTKPVDPSIPGGGDAVITLLEQRARELASEHDDEVSSDLEGHEAKEHDMDTMMVMSILETDPQVVIRALIAYFKARTARA